MRLDFSVGIYQTRRGHEDEWTALVPARYSAYIAGIGEVRLRERIVEKLRQWLKDARPADQELFNLPVGTELVHVPVDVKTQHGRVLGDVPVILEPRWTSADQQWLIAYHPERRHEWFFAESRAEALAIAQAFFRAAWEELDDDDLSELAANGTERLATVAFSCEPMSLIDQLPTRKKDNRAGASPRTQRVLQDLGVNETRRVGAGGVPRSPYRERLAYLLGGQRPRSVAVVGPPGSGKTTLIETWVRDRLAEDGYPIHKNYDRCHTVWRLSGKRLIAGMSRLGQWEERCLAVLHDARANRGLLWFEDLHLFGRLGQSRQSERSFADFFRGPVRRGDVCIIAELTPEQHARLERDAPGLAEALALVAVPAASPGETAQLLLHEVRALERAHPIALHPFVPRTALELGAALFPWRARPGVAIEIVRRVALDAVARKVARDVTSGDVLESLARTTGLSPKLISLDEPLDAAEVEAAFARRVIGQPAATRAAAEIVVKVRAGLADPGRPIGVMLFTGPTGTGKTELATAIAEYLYGDQSRLVRVDMGELSGPDAVARLIGDRWNPDGLLTSRVRAQPFCVVLLDEIEKAHPRALHLLLQLFDEGRLTDAAGDVASFASAVVIMTSNLGSRTAAPIGFGDTRDRILADVARAVRDFFPIELFNRIDQVVPFEPLTHEVAAKVVDKELAKLLARRGLRERNTFVYAGSAVRRRAVADAFDPRYGARTVKRWLEDQIGGALTDLLATAPPARLRIVRLSEHEGKLVSALEPMAEKTPAPGPYVLEGALDLATAALEPAIAAAVAALERIAASPHWARARAEAPVELRYYVDTFAQSVATLRELFGLPPLVDAATSAADAPDPHDEDDDYDIDDDDVAALRARTHKRKRPAKPGTRAPAAPPRPPASRDALVAGIAEAIFLDRALPRLLDPDAHAATAILSRVGATADAAGLLIVARTLGQRAWLEDCAQITGTAAEPLTVGDFLLDRRAGESDDAYVDRLRRPKAAPRDLALSLRALFVAEAIATAHGTWMVRATAAEPDIVRVELRPGTAQSPLAALRAHAAARVELERVLEHGGALPPNPDALLPVTRTLAYRPPLRPGEPWGIELEDFATGWVDRGLARDLDTALRRAWYLAWSKLS